VRAGGGHRGRQGLRSAAARPSDVRRRHRWVPLRIHLCCFAVLHCVACEPNKLPGPIDFECIKCCVKHCISIVVVVHRIFKFVFCASCDHLGSPNWYCRREHLQGRLHPALQLVVLGGHQHHGGVQGGPLRRPRRASLGPPHLRGLPRRLPRGPVTPGPEKGTGLASAAVGHPGWRAALPCSVADSRPRWRCRVPGGTAGVGHGRCARLFKLNVCLCACQAFICCVRE